MSNLYRLAVGPRRGFTVAIASFAACAALFSLPSVRGAADQFLQSMRVNSVVFMPINHSRIEQLASLHINPRELFVSRPETVVGNGVKPRRVATVERAAALTGLSLQQPSQLPAGVTDRKTYVIARRVERMQIKTDTLRQALDTLGVKDVTVPEALGEAPVTIDMPSSVMAVYRGNNYSLRLYQGTSPTVTLPPGVQLSDLGRVALRALGMTPDQADATSKQINWSTTLLFPFPADLTSIRQVKVNGSDGLLVDRNAGRGRVRLGREMLYWQKGDHFYVLEGQGASMDGATLVATANSVQ